MSKALHEMEEAIKAAERDAALAEANFKSAQNQLAEWTAEEKAVIKQLKGIGAVLESPAFAAVTNGFVQAHKHVFEYSEENKFEYSNLHEKCAPSAGRGRPPALRWTWALTSAPKPSSAGMSS